MVSTSPLLGAHDGLHLHSIYSISWSLYTLQHAASPKKARSTEVHLNRDPPPITATHTRRSPHTTGSKVEGAAR